jgi:hypothetical protein
MSLILLTKKFNSTVSICFRYIHDENKFTNNNKSFTIILFHHFRNKIVIANLRTINIAVLLQCF